MTEEATHTLADQAVAWVKDQFGRATTREVLEENPTQGPAVPPHKMALLEQLRKQQEEIQKKIAEISMDGNGESRDTTSTL